MNSILPSRYYAFALCVLGLLASVAAALAAPHLWTPWACAAAFAALGVTGVYDLRQPRHAILRNYPVIGHLRFLLEYVRPEIRQYFIESDREAAPFSRAQRSLVYQRAKGEPDNRPFGTQLDVGVAGERVRNFHDSTLHALKELVQAAGLDHPQQITAHHIVRRISDTEVRLLSNLVLQVKPGTLLHSLEAQHNVFRTYWPLASAHSFQPLTGTDTALAA